MRILQAKKQKADSEPVGLLLEARYARKGEAPRLAKHSFARGRTPAALRRAGNPRAHKEKANLRRLAFSGRLARPEGFEPPTPKFVAWCSIQLSYGRAVKKRNCANSK
jgi:hypothetical protein